MANTNTGKSYTGISATQSAFKLAYGGLYGIDCIGSGFGTVALQRLAADGITYVTVATFSANGYQAVSLPSGTYQVAVTSATAVSINIQAVNNYLN